MKSAHCLAAGLDSTLHMLLMLLPSQRNESNTRHNATLQVGATPLYVAALKGHLEVVFYIL